MPNTCYIVKDETETFTNDCFWKTFFFFSLGLIFAVFYARQRIWYLAPKVHMKLTALQNHTLGNTIISLKHSFGFQTYKELGNGCLICKLPALQSY